VGERGERGEHGPGGVGREPSGWLVGPGAVDEVGEDRFDDGVPAVSDVCVGEGFGVVGEKRVVPPDGEQRVEVVWSLTRPTISRVVTGWPVVWKAV